MTEKIEQPCKTDIRDTYVTMDYMTEKIEQPCKTNNNNNNIWTYIAHVSTN